MEIGLKLFTCDLTLLIIPVLLSVKLRHNGQNCMYKFPLLEYCFCRQSEDHSLHLLGECRGGLLLQVKGSFSFNIAKAIVFINIQARPSYTVVRNDALGEQAELEN
jgi:hypothetical protein